jgi:hypothetical protein
VLESNRLVVLGAIGEILVHGETVGIEGRTDIIQAVELVEHVKFNQVVVLGVEGRDCRFEEL